MNNYKETILKIEGQTFPLNWVTGQETSWPHGYYYCEELKLKFHRLVSSHWKAEKEHECERECPTSPCNDPYCELR